MQEIASYKRRVFLKDHPVVTQRIVLSSAGHRNAHIPVDLLLPKLTVLKLLLAGAVGIFAGKLLPALSAVHLPPLGLLIHVGLGPDLLDTQLVQRRQIPDRFRSLLVSGRKGPQIRELRLDHIIQQRFNLCHMLFLLSKIRIGLRIINI